MTSLVIVKHLAVIICELVHFIYILLNISDNTDFVQRQQKLLGLIHRLLRYQITLRLHNHEQVDVCVMSYPEIIKVVDNYVWRLHISSKLD